MDRISHHIFLIGFMGTGKSTISRELKQMLAMERMEMDQKIVEQQGMPISQLFEEFGEDYFRDIESRMLLDLQKEQPLIVSCGGGIVVREENIGYMKKSGKVVLLTAEPKTVYERVKDSEDRPILNGNMNVEYISGLMEKRRAKYEAAADIVVATDGKSVSEICEEIVSRLAVNK